MVKANSTARERIIHTTTHLIKELGDLSKITVRDIADKSEVGIGSINYHFQTKDNLIGICILRIINQFIEETEKLYQSMDMKPVDKLKLLFKSKCDFLVANPVISKTSMMLDLNSAGIGDNTDQAAKVLIKVLKEIYGNQKLDSELFILLNILMSSIQGAFLRNNVLMMYTDMDFFDREHRERLIDSLIDIVIQPVD